LQIDHKVAYIQDVQSPPELASAFRAAGLKVAPERQLLLRADGFAGASTQIVFRGRCARRAAAGDN
jgi:hypothetical protein